MLDAGGFFTGFPLASCWRWRAPLKIGWPGGWPLGLRLTAGPDRRFDEVCGSPPAGGKMRL